MSDMDEDISKISPNKDPRLARFDRNFTVKQRSKAANDIGKIIYNKCYPYVDKSDSSDSSYNSSEHNSASSFDSISSIGSNHDIHNVEQKCVSAKTSLADLNCKIVNHNKTPKQGNNLSSRSRCQIAYYDIQTGKDYTKNIHKILHLLKDMDVDGISEVFRRNNLSSKIHTESNDETAKEDSKKQSITVFRTTSQDKDPSIEAIIDLRNCDNASKYKYSPCNKQFKTKQILDNDDEGGDDKSENRSKILGIHIDESDATPVDTKYETKRERKYFNFTPSMNKIVHHKHSNTCSNNKMNQKPPPNIYHWHKDSLKIASNTKGNRSTKYSANNDEGERQSNENSKNIAKLQDYLNDDIYSTNRQNSNISLNSRIVNPDLSISKYLDRALEEASRELTANKFEDLSSIASRSEAGECDLDLSRHEDLPYGAAIQGFHKANKESRNNVFLVDRVCRDGARIHPTVSTRNNELGSKEAASESVVIDMTGFEESDTSFIESEFEIEASFESCSAL